MDGCYPSTLERWEGGTATRFGKNWILLDFIFLHRVDILSIWDSSFQPFLPNTALNYTSIVRAPMQQTLAHLSRALVSAKKVSWVLAENACHPGFYNTWLL